LSSTEFNSSTVYMMQHQNTNILTILIDPLIIWPVQSAQLSRCQHQSICTGWLKNWHSFCTLSNINRFLKLFHCQNQAKMCNNTITKIPPHHKCVFTLPCEMSNVLEATIENKTISVTTNNIF